MEIVEGNGSFKAQGRLDLTSTVKSDFMSEQTLEQQVAALQEQMAKLAAE